MKAYYDEYIIYTRNSLQDSTKVMVGYSGETLRGLVNNDRITDIRVVSQKDLIEAYESDSVKSKPMPKHEPKFKIRNEVVYDNERYYISGIDNSGLSYGTQYYFIGAHDSPHVNLHKKVKEDQLVRYDESSMCFKKGDLFIIKPESIERYEDVTEGRLYEVKYAGQMGKDLVCEDDLGEQVYIYICDIVRVNLDKFHSHTLCDGKVEDSILYKDKCDE